MKGMKLSVKLVGAFVVVALITILVGLIGVVKIRAIDEASTAVFEQNTKPLAYISGVATDFQVQRNMVRDAVITKFMYEKDITEHISKIKELDQKGIGILKTFGETVKSEDMKREFDTCMAALGEYLPLREKLFNLIQAGKRDEAIQFMQGDIAAHGLKITASIGKLVDMKIADAKSKAENNNATARGAIWFTSVATAIGTLLAVLLGVYLSLSITRPINRVTAGLADGASQVAAASAQVSSASQDLAEGASEQASSLEETSSSLEELSSMTKQNANNADQAKQMMAQARQIVAKVDNHMNGMVAAINEISKSSEETGKIIKTIDEIAFQTNLLALNAAVEAARAGEAGAGFAVVADEVRNLAMRAAEAAKNTNNLIDNTLKVVKNGSDVTLMTKEAFGENTAIAAKVGELIDEIAAASNEQAQGIDQINKAVAEMDKVTQQTAANAEESASASEEMNAQAEQMKVFVNELLLVIGGTDNGAASSTGLHNVVLGRSRKIDTAWKKDNGSGKTLVSRNMGGRRTMKPASPNEIIPMDEEEFKDF
jgi:hypothetical protein